MDPSILSRHYCADVLCLSVMTPPMMEVCYGQGASF
jgi:hypothetical protein